jgi:uncharacterized membrane protein
MPTSCSSSRYFLLSLSQIILITGTLLAATQETLQKLKKPSHRLKNIKRIFTELIGKVSSGYLQLFERNLVGPSGQRN